MGIESEWPEYTPDLTYNISISSSLMTLSAGSKVENISDYSEGTHSGLFGTIWQNGSLVGELTINRTTGAVSMSSLAVSTGDAIELRVEYMGRLSLDWISRAVLRRSAMFDVSGANQTLTFDGSTHTMPVPLWTAAFGWDASDYFKIGFDISSDGGASQDMSVETRMLGTSNDHVSASTIDLDSDSVETHTSTFTKTEIVHDFQVSMVLRSSASKPRQEDIHTLVFCFPPELDAYPASFPTSGAMLEQSLPSGTHAPELDEA